MVGHNISSTDIESIDEETKNWPIEYKHRDELDLIKPSHRAVPLRIYKDNKFVEPADVNGALPNAEIEIQFSVHHVYLQNQTPPRDSFRANIEQIVILKSGKRLQSIRKQDPRSGPISAMTTDLKRDAQDILGGTQKRAKTSDDEERSDATETEEGKMSKGKNKENVEGEE